jgi:hypothetical protein
LTTAVFWILFYVWVNFGPESTRLAVSAGLVFGLLFGLQGSRRNPQDDIQPAEALTWSWAEARKGLPAGLLLLGATIVTLALLYARTNPVQIWLLFAIIYGLIIALALFLIYGLRGKTLEASSFPNQGIFLSGRNALRADLLLAGVSGLLYGLVYGPFQGLLVGLRLWVLGGFWYGGFDLLKHATLRVLLYLDGRTPPQFVRFLDWAAGVQFLHRVGGGYVFANRLIQEYFGGKTSL